MKKSSVEDRDRGWGELFATIDALRGGLVAKVGILGDESEGGLHEEGADLTVAEIGAVNEFGTQNGHVPERSFLRSTFDRMRHQLGEDAAKLIGQIIMRVGDMTPERALNILGAKLAAEVKKTIGVGPPVPPPNAPSTMARKAAKGATGGVVRTLVDTGRLLASITWAVVKGERGGAGEVRSSG